jgi:hypothetical protein
MSETEVPVKRGPGRPRKHPITLPKRFVPRFWQEQDQRSSIVRRINRLYQRLKKDTGAKSSQRDILVQRAAFICVRLETMEVDAALSGEFDPGHYSSMVKALHQVLRSLGLDKKHKKAVTLQAYMKDK